MSRVLRVTVGMLALGIGGWLWTLRLGAATAPATTAPAPPATGAGAPAPQAPTPTPDLRRVVDLESPGTPIVMDPVRPISIGVRALIPNGNYRARVLRPNRPPGWRQSPMPRMMVLNISGEHHEVCQARQTALKDIFEAKTVDEAVRLAKAFEAAGPESRCPPMEMTLTDQLKRLSPELAYGIEPSDGTDLKLTVEQVDDAGAVIKRYEWPIVPAQVAPVLTETAWIVNEVTGRVAALARDGLSPTATLSGGRGHQFEVRGLGAGTASTLDVSGNLWEPGAYVPIARAAGVTPRADAAKASSSDVLAVLTTPLIENLLSVNRELGAALGADRWSRATHERAALLLACLGLRASTTGLEDIRPLLNRAVAHLALASAASASGPGVEAELARAAIDALIGRQVASATRLEALKPRLKAPAELAWYRALMMRATGDWRIYPVTGETRLLEQLEFARALARSWNPRRAADFRRRLGQHTESALWGRAILADHVSVELGNELWEPQLRLEQTEADRLAREFGFPNLQRWLEAKPTAEGLTPVSADLWARLAEGSVADAAWKYDLNLASLPPSPAAGAFRVGLAAALPTSTIIQALAAYWAANGGTPGLVDKCEDLARWIADAPFGLSARAFSLAAVGCGRMERAFPSIADRFTPWRPPGTLFDFANRLQISALIEPASKDDWSYLRGLTFYEPTILGFSVGMVENREPGAQDYKSFRRETAFSLAMLRDWRFVTSTRGVLTEALEPGRAACSIDEAECVLLVDILRAAGLPDEAFTVAGRAFGGDTISVTASNYVTWFIDENVRRGNLAMAEQVADRAAATGSYLGLLVRARLTERLGRADEAFGLYSALDATYDARNASIMRIRQLVRDGRGSRADVLRGLAALAAPTRVGLGGAEIVEGVSAASFFADDVSPYRRLQVKALGLEPTDAIVAVNGFEIKNDSEFWAVLTFSDEPTVELKVRSATRRGVVTLRGPLGRANYGLIRPGKVAEGGGDEVVMRSRPAA